MAVSVPTPPSITSDPAVPKKVSFPEPPLKKLLVKLPVIVSENILPIRFSMLIKVSLPEPPLN